MCHWSRAYQLLPKSWPVGNSEHSSLALAVLTLAVFAGTLAISSCGTHV